MAATMVVLANPLLQKQFVVLAGNQSLVPASESDTLFYKKWAIFGVG
jgi:hypothetical protein